MSKSCENESLRKKEIKEKVFTETDENFEPHEDDIAHSKENSDKKNIFDTENLEDIQHDNESEMNDSGSKQFKKIIRSLSKFDKT